MLYPFEGRLPLLGERVWIAPTSAVIGDVSLADDASVWFQAVLRGDIEPIRVGAESNIQDGAVLHTDEGYPCEVGRRVTIGHHAIVHGARVGDGALIGMGATVLSGAVVGEGALVAAGALVPEGKEIPPGHLAIGVPAKVVRELSEEERVRVAAGVEAYLDRKRRYLAAGIGQGG